MFYAYEDGYDKGKIDGYDSKSQHFNKHLNPIKAILSQAYIESFGKGYKNGYVQGRRQREYESKKIHKTTSIDR